MDQRPQRMSRGVRTARGVLGAVSTTVLAAASHALAGGAVTLLALIVTAALALPICVALSGRIASLWRLCIAVGVSQFFYHWTFAGLGASMLSGPGDDGRSAASPLPAHAAHIFDSFSPAWGAPQVGADLSMWISHALTALVTIALLHRGEVAGLQLLRLLSSVIPALPEAPRIAPVPRGLRLQARPTATLGDGIVALSSISHRGPPLSCAFTLS